MNYPLPPARGKMRLVFRKEDVFGETVFLGIVDVEGVGVAGAEFDEFPGGAFLLPEGEGIGAFGVADGEGLAIGADDLAGKDSPAGVLAEGAEEFHGGLGGFFGLGADGVEEFLAQGGADGDFFGGQGCDHKGSGEGEEYTGHVEEATGSEGCVYGGIRGFGDCPYLRMRSSLWTG